MLVLKKKKKAPTPTRGIARSCGAVEVGVDEDGPPEGREPAIARGKLLEITILARRMAPADLGLRKLKNVREH